MATSRIRTYQNIKLVAFLTILLLFFFLILFVKNLLVSVMIGIIISYFLSPVIDALERTGIGRSISIFLCFAILSGGLVVLGIWMAPMIGAQAISLQKELPRYISGTTEFLAQLETRIEGSVGGSLDIALGERAERILSQNTNAFFEQLPQIISHSLTVLLLAPFLAFFLLKDGNNMSRRIFSLIPNNIFEMSFHLHHQINKQMGQFIRARLMESIIVGAIIWAGLWILNFPYVTLIAAFAALTNLIPYIGPLIGAIPVLVIGFISGLSTGDMAVVMSVFLLAQLVDAVLLIPLVVAKIVDLHPVTVIVALLIGAQVLGILGMLIAIPVASIIKLTTTTLYEHLVEFRN